MFRLSIFLLSVACCSASGVTLTLDRAPGYAIFHNPQLAAARLRVEEARGRLLGSGRLKNPELEVDFSQNARMPERSLGIAFVQQFPLTARLRLEKAVSAAQVAAAQAELRDAERTLSANVRTAAVKYLALRAQRELRQEQLANSREQAQFVTQRVAAGEASAVDAAQLDLESRQVEVELLQLDAARATSEGELRLLLGVSADDSVEITGVLPPPASIPGTGGTIEERPDLEAARHTANAARQSVDLAKARKWEDIGVGVTATGERTEDAPEGYSNDYFFGFRLSLPLPLWNKNEGQIAEAAANARRAGKEADALAFNIRSEAESARGEMAALARVITEMDRELLPKATQVEEQLRNAYSAAQSPLTEVLRARARRIELSQRRADALRDYHLARVRYDAALGRNSRSAGTSGK